MAGISHTEQFDVALSVEEATQRFNDYFVAKRAKMDTTPDGELVAATGKRVWVRILGAFFVPRAWWPLKTTAWLTASGAGTSVDLTVMDNIGFGVRTGMRTKYDELVRERASAVRRAMN